MREFVAQFGGLSGSAKQKRVLEATGLARAPLRSLVGANGLDVAAVARLLEAMKAESREVPPHALGPIGAAALRVRFEAEGIEAQSFEYRRRMGTTDGVPWIVEAAFGWCPRAKQRRLVTGVNWSPGILSPFRALGASRESLDGLLAEQWADEHEPVVVAVHLAFPGASYTDRGKTALAAPLEVGDAIVATVTDATRKWAKQRAAEDRHQSALIRRRDALTKLAASEISFKEAARRVIVAAYMKASAGNTLPANARQIYYAARPDILMLTGKDRLDDHYFCQTLLPNYVNENPELTADWDVVFDARGHLVEPHTGRSVPLGTIEVRQYLNGEPADATDDAVASGFGWPTLGPENRFSTVLFFEKEGFDPLLRAARIGERYDVAIMSTKGMSVTAARRLLDDCAERSVKVLMAHDFDVSGFSIFGTLAGDTRRYTYKNEVTIIDIGLRLEDVRKWNLQDEPVSHRGDWQKITATLRRHGATAEEIPFLRTQRVELNAFTSDQFVAWLESKLEEHGITKVVPDAATLQKAARAAWRQAAQNALLEMSAGDLDHEAAEAELPDDLADRVRAKLAERPEMPWDEAVGEVVAELRETAVDEDDTDGEG